MREIKELARNMKEELCDAEKYAKQALEHKATDKRLGDMYLALAKAEIGHAVMEHEQAVRIIKEQKDSGKSIPAGMMELWNWEHEQLMEQEKGAKILIDMYEH